MYAPTPYSNSDRQETERLLRELKAAADGPEDEFEKARIAYLDHLSKLVQAQLDALL